MSRPPRAMIRRTRHGLGLIEMMISLVITSILLVAVAAAFQASASGITANDQHFRATQAARVAMTQMLARLRQVQEISVAPGGQSLSFFQADPDTGDDEQCTYQFDPDAHELRLVYNQRPDSPSVRMISNVADVVFHQDTDDINKDGVQFVVRVSISLRLQIGQTDIQLSGTAVPRRNLRLR